MSALPAFSFCARLGTGPCRPVPGAFFLRSGSLPKRLRTIARVSELLLHRVARGDDAAVRECIQHFGGLVWSLARQMLGTGAETEDAVQEIFTEVWKNAYKYDPSVASEATFVAMLARRRLIDRRRRLAARPEIVVADELLTSRGSNAEPPVASSEASSDVRRAWSAMNQLTPEQQTVVRLSVIQGLSHDKIARSLNLPLGTVKTHARRGLIRIRELMSRSSDPSPIPRTPGSVPHEVNS